jgi:hypothetical protein
VRKNTLGVPNFLNVVTNLPFLLEYLIVGIFGLNAIRKMESKNIKAITGPIYRLHAFNYRKQLLSPRAE